MIEQPDRSAGIDPARPPPTRVQIPSGVFVVLLLLLVVPWIWIAVESGGRPTPAPDPEEADAAALSSEEIVREGPWGRLIMQPITILPPEALIPPAWYGHKETKWIFSGWDENQVIEFFNGLQLDPDLLRKLTTESQWIRDDNGIVVAPRDDVIMALPTAARAAIYNRLSVLRSDIGAMPIWSIPEGKFEKEMERMDLGVGIKSLIRRLSYTQSGRVFVPDSFAIANTVTNLPEKVNLVRFFYSAQTMLVRLKVDHDSDIDAIANYWRSPNGRKDLRPILESVAKLPQGGSIDIAHLLPSLPRQRIYTYPHPSLQDDGVRRDCHWTSLNFFNIAVDDTLGIPEVAQQRIVENYHVVSSDEPRFGDLVFLVRSDGQIVHTAVYLAANLVYSKNGMNLRSPWIVTTLGDTLNTYSPDPDDHMQVQFWRRNE